MAGQVGFVGLGNMGAPMVARLLGAGRGVVAFDPDPAAGKNLAQRSGFSRLDRLAEVVAPVVILMLPSSDVVERVLLEEGLLAAQEPGSVLIDMSSSEPQRTRRLATLASEAGLTMLDAPVSGGVIGAETGKLTIMVGGSEEAFLALLPTFEAIGSRVARVGDSGAGHAVKALNNLMSGMHLLASSEALLAARGFGLDLELVLDLVNGSSGRSGSTEHKWPNFVLTGGYDSGFGMGLMVKDMRIALDLEGEVGTPRALSERAVELWSRAVADLPAGADHTEIVRWLERDRDAAGTSR